MQWDASYEEWLSARDSYHFAIKQKASRAPSLKALPSLDSSVQALQAKVKLRNPPHLTKAELSLVMSWKLKRAKFRPKLQTLVDSNDSQAVQQQTKLALKVLTSSEENALKSACNDLQKLKGVGPATASAILAAVEPNKTAFLSDEAFSVAPSCKGKPDYKLSSLLSFTADLASKRQQLQAEAKKRGAAEEEWTFEAVERALWSAAVLKHCGVEQTIEKGKGSGLGEAQATKRRRRL